MVEVNWSGKDYSLCHGEWQLLIDGVDYTSTIPKEKRNSPMNILNVYGQWGFDENWNVSWEWYSNGLGLEDWVKENPWVRELPAPAEEIYQAFKEKDWRHGSCGGCI